MFIGDRSFVVGMEFLRVPPGSQCFKKMNVIHVCDVVGAAGDL